MKPVCGLRAIVAYCILSMVLVSCDRRINQEENADEKGSQKRGMRAADSAIRASRPSEHGLPSSTRAVDDLLDELVNASGDENVEVWSALKGMQAPDLPDRAMAKLKTQTDPRKKAVLIPVVGYYGSAEAMRGLLEHLDDQRDAAPRCPECPPFPGWPLRVCDVTFNAFVARLAACGLLHESNIIQSSKLLVLRKVTPNYNFNETAESGRCRISLRDEYPARDAAILSLRQYFQTNWTGIVSRVHSSMPSPPAE